MIGKKIGGVRDNRMFTCVHGKGEDLVAFNIREARSVAGKGHINRAVDYLKGMAEARIENQARDEAVQLLDVAHEIIGDSQMVGFSQSGTPKTILTFYVLRMAELDHRLERLTQADNLFTRVETFANTVGTEDKEGTNIALALTYIRIKLLDRALLRAREIEGHSFGIFMDIAAAYRERGDISAAKRCLVDDAAKAAREKPEFLLKIAKQLIDMGEKDEGRILLRRVIKRSHDIKTCEDLENTEEAIILLLKAGEEKQFIVDFFTEGWVPKENEWGCAWKLQMIRERSQRIYEVLIK